MGSLIGKDLTRTGVQDVNGETRYFQTKLDALKKFVPEMAPAAQPTTSVTTATIPDAGSVATPSFIQQAPPVAKMPSLIKPSFGEGLDNPRALTGWGKALSLILPAMVGAAAGSGRRTAGEGAMAGLEADLEIGRERDRARTEALNRQFRQAQLSLLPVQQQTEQANLANVQAETELRKGQLAALNNKPDIDQNSSLPLMLAHATAAAIANGVNPADDETVKKIQAVIDAGQKDAGASNAADDIRYRKILTAQNLKQVVSPEDLAWAQAYKTSKLMVPTTAAQIRVEGFGDIKQQPAIDTKNNNALVFVSSNDINEANRKEPGRYVPAGEGTKALNKSALLEDIRGSIAATRESLNQIPEFDAATKAKIAVALRDRDPRSAVSQLIGGEAGRELTAPQQEYLINLAQLHEQAMAMRSVLGAGQGSEDLRAAILRTIPGPGTPNKQYAATQLDKFEQTLNRLSRGVPNVPLRSDKGTASNSSASGDGGGWGAQFGGVRH